MNLNEDWKARAVTVAGQPLEVHVRTFKTSRNCEEYWQREKSAVIESGCYLIYHLNYPPMIAVQLPDVPTIAYQYPHPPIPELWYLSGCSLNAALSLAHMLGFPDPKITADTESAFRKIEIKLLEMHQAKPLAITAIGTSYLSLELVKQNDSWNHQELLLIDKFNSELFPANESSADKRDRIRNWTQKCFVSLGAY